MRSILALALSLFLASCGSPAPRPVTSGLRLQASLAAIWPAVAPARQAVFSRDGNFVATSDASGLLTVRETRGWTVVEQLRHPGGATSVAFGDHDSLLFSGGYDGTIREWSLRRHALERVFRGPTGTVWTIDISPVGRKLAASGEDAIIRMWRLEQPSPPVELRGHTRNVWEVRFSPDGERLASGSFDKSVRLRDANSGRALTTLAGHTQAIVGLAFNPNGKLLATGSDDSTIRLWRSKDGRPLRTTENGTHVDKVAFSPDGQWLASGGHPHGTIAEIWHQLTGAAEPGEAVRLWRVADGALVLALPHPDDVIDVEFSPDGHWLVSSGEDKRFRLWRLRPANGQARNSGSRTILSS